MPMGMGMGMVMVMVKKPINLRYLSWSYEYDYDRMIVDRYSKLHRIGLASGTSLSKYPVPAGGGLASQYCSMIRYE